VIDSRLADMSTYVSESNLTVRQRSVRECADLLRQLIACVMNPRLADPSLADLREKLEAALEKACFDCDQAPVEMPGSEVHPWVGSANAVAPPMRLHLEDDMLVGLVECSSIYGEERVNGGVVAGLFDAIVATRGALSGTQMTAKLDIDYRRPVPLNRTLRMEAVIDRVEGRKHHLTARMLDGDTMLAEAYALTLLPKTE
jgi:acyl-coenzyme A thioesterase PaaI-like protein